MKRLNLYIIRQLYAAFAFFLLIFAGVIWLTQSVQLIDTVIASGQSLWTFVEFSLLVLPQVLVIVFPLSGIGAALYTLNRLYTDSELVAIMCAGHGPARLMMPITLFGLSIAAAQAIVLMVLIPIAGSELSDRTRAIRSDLAASLIVERQFIHPIRGLTLFIDDTGGAGEMSGIFLNDARDPVQPVTYSAERARFLSDGTSARLVMLDGVALAYLGNGELSTVTYEQFVYDLSDLVRDQSERTPRPSEYSVLELLNPTPEMLDTRYSEARYISEAHYKLSMPLLAMVYPMIALVTFLAGGYRRSGFGRRVIVAVGLAVFVQLIMFVCQAEVDENADLWPLMYLPQAIALAYTFFMLHYLARTRRPASRIAA
ncbi:MAG: LptF/LptG family permease [Pseudomonadota bacterium]